MKENKYLTEQNIKIIYTRLKTETNTTLLPILGRNLEFGLGEICLFEKDNLFVFYIMNKTNKECIKLFDNINDAINFLVNVYDYYKFTDNLDEMKNIFYEVLNLDKEITKTR